jgi:NAD(P)H-nitrite reductase large subunit
MITIVSEEAHPFYSRPGLAYYLRGDIPQKQLHIRMPDDLRVLNVSRVTSKVSAVDLAAHEVVLSNGTRLRYDRLLIATGARAVPPPFPGADLSGVVTLDGLDDARRIVARARRGRPAVVVGGGITALELAEGLAARGMKVRYLLRGKRYWSDVLDEAESRIVMDRLRHEGITILTETQVSRAVGNRGQVEAVETQPGEHLPCEVLAVAIGVRPHADLARAAGLAVNKGVLVNMWLQTNDPDVFAAGDVAEAADPRTGGTTLDVLWPTALTQGRVAGANMTGAAIPYSKGVPFNVTMLAGLRVAVIGAVGGARNEDLVTITRGESEAWRQPPVAGLVNAHDGVNRVRLLVGERTIVGALVMGDQRWVRPLQRLVVAEADITPIRPALVGGGSDVLQRLAAFYERWEGARPLPASGS